MHFEQFGGYLLAGALRKIRCNCFENTPTPMLPASLQAPTAVVMVRPQRFHPNPETAAITTPIEVTVRAPMTGNTIIPLRGLFTWLGDGTVSADVTMIKEFVDVVN